jgi:predicted DNA-binding protein with PD1-like motif
MNPAEEERVTVLDVPQGHLIRFHNGEEIFSGLVAFAEDRKITAAWVQGLGALRSAEIGYFDIENKKYLRRKIEEETELAGLIGNLALVDGRPFPHLHVTLGRKDFTCLSGHLFEGFTGATVEMSVSPFAGTELVRAPDELTGLNLWSLPQKFTPAS